MIVLKEIVIATTDYLTLKARKIQKGENAYFWEYVSRKNGEKSVAIAATDPFGRLVVTKEYRPSINDYEWGFPAGLVDVGETPRDTAIREMKEETGLDIINIRLISPFACNSAGLTDEVTAMVFADVEGKMSTEGLEGTEDITTFLMSPNEVTEHLSRKLIFAAKAWIVMERFSRTGFIL